MYDAERDFNDIFEELIFVNGDVAALGPYRDCLSRVVCCFPFIMEFSAVEFPWTVLLVRRPGVGFIPMIARLEDVVLFDESIRISIVLELPIPFHSPLCGRCEHNQECDGTLTFCRCVKGTINSGSSQLNCIPIFVDIKPHSLIKAIALILGIVEIIAVVTVMIMFLLNRNTKLIRITGRFQTQGTLFGILGLIIASTPFIIQPTSSNYVCLTRPLVILPLGLVLGTIFAKAWRIQKIVNMTKLHFKRVKLTDLNLYQKVGQYLGVMTLILIVWYILFTPGHEYQFDGDRRTSECSTEWLMIAIIGIIIFVTVLWGIVQAWASRSAPIGANECHEILVSIFVFVFFGTILIPLQFSNRVASDVDAMTLLRGFGILLFALVLLIALFVKKIFWIFTGKADSKIMVQSPQLSPNAVPVRHVILPVRQQIPFSTTTEDNNKEMKSENVNNQLQYAHKQSGVKIDVNRQISPSSRKKSINNRSKTYHSANKIRKMQMHKEIFEAKTEPNLSVESKSNVVNLKKEKVRMRARRRQMGGHRYSSHSSGQSISIVDSYSAFSSSMTTATGQDIVEFRYSVTYTEMECRMEF
eukprot:TRINITY_DN6014_c0_g3_i1.p1 TRINITY_DN6014_c0_g3~~TRINITY_DN6014_c0_g3_i1.p1  ORF type:complete len:657 (+),score=80.36 TRINITY_DN6014_c0_g3_i1:220-1971(+)